MSALVWDTTLASRLRPGSPLLDDVSRQASVGDPVGITTISLLELSYGMRKAADAGRSDFARLHAWLREFVAAGHTRVITLGADAALLAGEVRALLPVSPASGRRRTRSKAEARVAWVHDIQIACATWEAGCDIATADVDHFTAIAGCINAIVLDAPPLEIVAGPPS